MIESTQEVRHGTGPAAEHRHRQRRKRPQGNLNKVEASINQLAVGQSLQDQPPMSSARDSEPTQSRTSRATPRHQNGLRPNGRSSNASTSKLLTPVPTASNRPFGGSLTTSSGEIPNLGPSASSLRAGAPEFQPDLAIMQEKMRLSQKRPAAQPKKRRPSKSNAPDVTTRIHEDINNRQYECPICTSEVLRHSKIWYCHTCWTVFHMSCIKTWSSNNDASQAHQNGQSEEISASRQWRCPGCNLPQDSKPSVYTCWCGKDHDPKPIPGLPPHSCGQTCGKSRVHPKKCPHPCDLLCHAGPCPPCNATGPVQSCFCGKQSVSKRCIDTNYDSGWSCGTPCGDVMPCGEHCCQNPCHEGLCGACKIQVDAKCYCGKTEKPILCCDREEELQSSETYLQKDGQIMTDNWTGIFECRSTCQRPFDCGIHLCQKTCHSLGGLPTHCPRSPDVTSCCPCGKTDLADISAKLRESCEDPIPNCSKICNQLLHCGHTCQQKCHTGFCLPCLQTVTINCRCGRTSLSTICHQGTEEAPQCTRVCRTTLNCGRHECGEHCCSGERRATERQAFKRKPRPLDSAPHLIDEGFEAEHICTRICGKLLKCGSHTCEELCHKGPCGSCREATFDELSCHCGRTVLHPPLHCGAKPPLCRYECERPKPCDHPQIPHNCHLGDGDCPKCPFLTEKVCLCGKKTLKNQQCWFTDVRCGEICGRKLKCGSHACRKSCHKPGDCEDVSKPCSQLCSKPKRVCGHPCEHPCHAPYPCREEIPCRNKVIVTCNCQHNRREMVCNASMDTQGNLNQTLECNDECKRLERNRKLALALDIDPETHKDEHVPYSKETIALYQENINWSQTQEREFRVLASSQIEKRLRFKPMPAEQRAFLHHLAEDFGFDSESLDPEPYRHVLVFKSPRFVSAPAKTVGDCVRIRQNQQAKALESRPISKSSNVREPYNGLLLTSARFALTVDELSNEIAAVQGPSPKLQFQIYFLPSEEVALLASNKGHTERTIDLTLKELKIPLTRAFTAHGFGSLQLCRLDLSNNVTRRETDTTSEGGWSQVAAKAAAPRPAPQVVPIGTGSSFTVLGNLNKKKKDAETRKLQEVVVDNWEEAEELAEQQNSTAPAESNETVVRGPENAVNM